VCAKDLRLLVSPHYEVYFCNSQAGDADNPGHLSVYSKILAEWIAPKEIDAAGIFDLKPAETSAEAYRITLADYGVASEYLLIENRQPLEFDINIWSGGLVIYHIDDAADRQEKLGYPGQDGWPGNGNHYQVAVLPKDGNYDLEQGKNNGDAGDFWVPGNVLGPGKGGSVYPNTDLYQSGFVQETGIWLKVLSQTGQDVKFQVGGFDGEAPPAADAETPVSTTPTTILPASPISSTAAPAKSPSPISVAPTKGTPRPTTISPTPGPTVVTSKPTPAPTVVPTPAPVPASFINYVVTRTPTHEPTTHAFLNSFRPYGGQPTPVPKAGPPLSTPGQTDGFLSSFGQSPASTSRRPFLSTFGGEQELQEGPPREESDFLSSSTFGALIGSSPVHDDEETDSFEANQEGEPGTENEGGDHFVFVAEGSRFQSAAMAWSMSLFAVLSFLTWQGIVILVT
jgi:hypothetical protein